MAPHDETSANAPAAGLRSQVVSGVLWALRLSGVGLLVGSTGLYVDHAGGWWVLVGPARFVVGMMVILAGLRLAMFTLPPQRLLVAGAVAAGSVLAGSAVIAFDNPHVHHHRGTPERCAELEARAEARAESRYGLAYSREWFNNCR